MRIFRATLRKLVRRPATWVSLGIMVGLFALITVAVGATVGQLPNGEARLASLALLTFPTAYLLVLAFVLFPGGMFAVLYAASVGGSEWGWGTLKMAVARGESRWRYSVGTFAAVALALGIAIVAFGLVAILLVRLGAALAGVDPGNMADTTAVGRLPDQLARSWLAITEQAAVGYAIATVARSQLAGIGAGIGLYFGEQFAGVFLPDQIRYLPFHVANAVVEQASTSTGGGQLGGASLSGERALVATIAWLIAGVGIAALFTDRAEIPG